MGSMTMDDDGSDRDEDGGSVILQKKKHTINFDNAGYMQTLVGKDSRTHYDADDGKRQTRGTPHHQTKTLQKTDTIASLHHWCLFCVLAHDQRAPIAP